MSRTLYTEQQSFRQVKWIWYFILPVALLSVLSIAYGFYQQIILNEPWGNEPMSNIGLSIALLVVIVSQAIVIWVVANIQLSLEVSAQELRYKFFTYFTQWNTLTQQDISGYTFEKYSFWKGMGLGYRKNIFTKTVRMIIKPSHILTIKTRDGKTLLMSIENKEALERAMHKLMSTHETY